MQVLRPRFVLITALVVALLSPAVMANDIIIDDKVNSEWISVTGTWTTGTSSSAKKGDSYLYCSQSPGNGNSVTFTPDLGATGMQWEVYIWYPAGMDRTVRANVTVHHAGTEPDTVLQVNQQQNGGTWVFLGTYDMNPGTGNYVQITNNGPDINKIVVADAVRFYSHGGDQSPPIISNVQVVAGSESAVITWDTDEPADSQVEYGTTIGYGNLTTLDNADVTQHSVSITGLDPLTLYHFRIHSTDAVGNSAISPDHTFRLEGEDKFPPLISGLTVVPGARSVVVTWLTDEPADTLVSYGETTSYGSSSVLDTRLITYHHVTIRGLEPSTGYHLRAQSLDGAGNTGVSDDVAFTTTPLDTTPPEISEETAYPETNSVLITWHTNENSTSQVEYGPTSSYGNITTEDLELVMDHSVLIPNLLPETDYHYRVISTDDSGNTSVSSDHTFTTKALDIAPPKTYTVKADPGSRTCVITWVTDEPATSQVRYGTSNPPTGETVEDITLVTDHSVTLTNLLPDTKYYYAVVSCDARRNCVTKGVYWFTTKSADVTPPVISEVSADPGSNSVVITWVTDEPATSLVGYGIGGYTSQTPLDSELVTDHRVVITGLDPDTTYTYCVVSKDAESNEINVGPFYFTTGGPDETPPVISEISVSRRMDSAIVRWKTNEPANSQVEYGITTDYGSESPLDVNLVTLHSVTLEGLLTDTLYHFRVKSTDGAGNTTVSEDHTFATSSTAPEYRMIWADTWHNGFLSAEETTAFVNKVSAANYNAIVVEVRKAGDAYYISQYEPWGTNITPPEGAYDPLQDLIDKAHAKGIEVHAWIVTYRAWFLTYPDAEAGHVWAEHGPESAEDWSMRTSGGGYQEGNSLNIDPGVPGVQDYIANIVKDIVGQYQTLDGINFDYVRYPGTNWGYNQYVRWRFQYEHGYYPPTSPVGEDGSNPSANWQVWCDYRRQQVTDLLTKCYVEAMYLNPRIKMSVDTVGWDGADPNTEYERTPQYAGVFQDARGWMNQHIIDINILMNYKREYNTVQKASYREWANWLPRAAGSSGRLAVDGQGIYMNSISASIDQMTYSRNSGCDGLCAYSYAVTNKDGQPAGAFFDAVTADLFSQPAPIPDMPWKDQPTTGIIFGTITDVAEPNHPIYRNWIYKASVTIRGPVERTTRTDATGTYAFLDLPPGIYRVAISKEGYGPKAFGGLELSAGDVLRKDAAIESGMLTSPPGMVTAGWNLLSLPAQPADPNPLVVFQGIDIDGTLYRRDGATQNLIIYSQYSPSDFGDVSIDDGYWLWTPVPSTISYEPADVAPQTERTIALPRAGWYIIGCPFMGPKDWNMVTVSQGLYTRPISTARNLGWLNTICYWWDNNGSNIMTLGLDDDYADTTLLQPWKGYWLHTGIDNLSITFH